MPPNSSESEEPRIYTVRLSEPAEIEIETAYLSLMGATSLGFADRWQDNLLQAINSLSLFPRRFEAVMATGKQSANARRMIFRQGRVAYRVFFDLMDEDGDGQEDTVVIQHVRYGAQQEAPREVAEDE